MAEFVATLISEAFEAVTVSLVDQAIKHASLLSSAALSLEEFADRTVNDGDIDEALGELFPTKDGEASTVQVGADYRPGRPNGLGEAPPVFDVLGITLGPRDFTKKRKQDGYRLTARGVTAIREATRLRLAGPGYEAIAVLARDGIPRVVVDSGRVSAKVTFKVQEVGDDPPAGTESSPPAAMAGAHVLLASASPLPMERLTVPNVRMVVRQADPDAPQTERSGHVLGEVDITFKTVQ